MKGLTQSGKTVESQRLVDFRGRDPKFRLYDPIQRVVLEPSNVVASREACLAILNADVIVISCGSINGNVRAPFAVRGIKKALRQRIERAEKERIHLPIVYVMNFMTELGVTQFEKSYDAADIVDIIEEAIGYRLSCVIYGEHNEASVPKSVLAKYRPERWIRLGKLKNRLTLHRNQRPFIFSRDMAMLVPNANPDLPPKILHDPKKLGAVLAEIFPQFLEREEPLDLNKALTGVVD